MFLYCSAVNSVKGTYKSAFAQVAATDVIFQLEEYRLMRLLLNSGWSSPPSISRLFLFESTLQCTKLAILTFILRRNPPTLVKVLLLDINPYILIKYQVLLRVHQQYPYEVMRGKQTYDAIIVGAGHNGLVAANYLARAGKSVLMLEKRHVVGGAAVTQQLIPGFKFSRFSYVLSLFRRSIIKDLDLFNKGLKIHFREASSLTPTKQVGKYLLMYGGDQRKTKQEIAKFSKQDAQRWDQYNNFLNAVCDFWDKRIETLPYNFIENPTLKDKFLFLKSLIFRGVKPFDLSSFVTSSVQNVLNKWFQSQILKATLATDGIIGENLPITHTSTAYILLHHVMGELVQGRKGDWGYVQGGNGRLTQILADSAKAYGVQIQTNREVNSIIYQNNKPIGVELKGGERMLGNNILSNCTHKVTFQKLIPEADKLLPKEMLHKLKSVQYNGAATKLNIALKGLPKFKCLRNAKGQEEQLLQGTIHINCETFESLKRAFRQTSKHRISQNPFVDVTIPSTLDKTLCPQGYHIMNALMQYTPYHPNNQEGITQISHEEVKRVFLNSINQYLDEPLDVHYMDILTPFDIEKVLNMTEGNIFHGAIGLDNLYVHRPSGKIAGVWICGSSGHPGGGVMGAVGKQVAQEILNKHY